MMLLLLLGGLFAAGLGWTWPLAAVNWVKNRIFPPKEVSRLSYGMEPAAEVAIWQSVMGGVTIVAIILGYIFVDTAIMNRLLLAYLLSSLVSATLIWVFIKRR